MDRLGGGGEGDANFILKQHQWALRTRVNNNLLLNQGRTAVDSPDSTTWNGKSVRWTPLCWPLRVLPSYWMLHLLMIPKAYEFDITFHFQCVTERTTNFRALRPSVGIGSPGLHVLLISTNLIPRVETRRRYMVATWWAVTFLVAADRYCSYMVSCHIPGSCRQIW
jgi:hypothetical protein